MLLEPIRTLLVQDRIPANLPIVEAVRSMDVLEIVGTVWTLEKVNIALRIHAPELVLLDWALAAVSASSVCSVAKSRLLAPKVVMVMPEADERHRRSASLAGADASVSRPTFAADMETALALLFEARFRGPTGKA